MDLNRSQLLETKQLSQCLMSYLARNHTEVEALFDLVSVLLVKGLVRDRCQLTRVRARSHLLFHNESNDGAAHCCRTAYPTPYMCVERKACAVHINCCRDQVDYGEVRRFCNDTVPSTYSPVAKRAILAHFVSLFSADPLPQTLLTVAAKQLVLPVLRANDGGVVDAKLLKSIVKDVLEPMDSQPGAP